MSSMILDVLPDNEETRLQALRRLGILDSGRSKEFDALVETAAAVFGCPIALVTFVDEHEQWFKARCGLEMDGTARSAAICRHTILESGLLVVPDLASDPRFRHDPLVTGAPHARFYAGYPLSLDGVHRLGSLCVIDTVPRTPSPEQLQQLSHLGVAAEGLIRAYAARVEAAALREEAQRQQALVQTQAQLIAQTTSISGVGGWELDLELDRLLWTDQVRRLLEVDDDYEPDMKKALGFFTPEARCELRRALDDARLHGFPFSLELPARTASGRERWVRLAGKPLMRGDKVVRIVGAIRDVTDRKMAEIRLQHSEALYRTTLVSLSEGVVVVDPEGRVLSHNPAALAMLGLQGREITGLSLAALDLDFIDKGHDGVRLGNLLAKGAEDPARLSSTVAGLTLAEGAPRWLNLNAVAFSSPVEGAGGGVVISLTDVTRTVRQAMTIEGVFQNYPGAVVYFDQDLVVAGWNRTFERLLDVSPEYLAGRPSLADYVLMNAERGEYGEGDPQELARDRLKEILGGREHGYERSRPNGDMLEIRGTFLPGGGLLSTFTDISGRKRIERQLIEKERLARERSDELGAVLANMNQGVSVFDREGRLTLWNEQYTVLFGLDDGGRSHAGRELRELIVSTNADVGSHNIVDARVAQIMQQLSAGETVRSMFRLRSGRIISTVHAPLPDGGWVGTHEDVTERERAADKVLHAARHDTLTGLANRTYLNERLQELVADGASDQPCLGILMLIDLDRFKPVNDALGHNAGDLLLCEVANRLRRCARENDFVARIGGDEFAVLLSCETGCDRPSDLAEAVAQRILTAISARFSIDGSSVQIGASIGIAPVLLGADLSELMRQADAALYEVKNQGRNGFRAYRPAAGAPEAALDQDNATVVWPAFASAGVEARTNAVQATGIVQYQPIVCLHSRELRGYQVLQPGAGQGGASGDGPQETAVLESATSALLREVLSAAVRTPADQKIALSLSVRQFGLETLASIVENEIDIAGITPERIHLQVADSYFLVNSGAALRQFQALRAIGVRLVLDRFGSDSSSLQLLGRFSFDSLRIDRSALQDMLAGARGETVIRALVAVARTFDVDVAVDGIDNEEAAQLLQASGCVEGQGGLFAAPGPIETFLSVA
ncbi:bifunctional diguanylate cyclase/phosphodiesterase [Stappia indica]|uniref:Diguanylate cyclase n=1 Tax=Stappia indica TaxID=538381 RepID=A0A857CCI3_9HYPH|nr:PAS-domain containing protein [Stappia indica]QGZ36565.1 diguanylate cyclase [Stappia indica]